jgi:hypothetical protein
MTRHAHVWAEGTQPLMTSKGESANRTKRLRLHQCIGESFRDDQPIALVERESGRRRLVRGVHDRSMSDERVRVPCESRRPPTLSAKHDDKLLNNLVGTATE